MSLNSPINPILYTYLVLTKKVNDETEFIGVFIPDCQAYLDLEDKNFLSRDVKYDAGLEFVYVVFEVHGPYEIYRDVFFYEAGAEELARNSIAPKCIYKKYPINSTRPFNELFSQFYIPAL